MDHRHWCQFVSYGILILFLGIMIYVVITAYTRPSGSTGLDIATIQKVRHDAASQQSLLSPSNP